MISKCYTWTLFTTFEPVTIQSVHTMTEIKDLFNIYSAAVRQRDVDMFTAIFDDNVRIFDMWEWTYDGLTPWREMAKGWFSSLGSDEQVVVTFDDVRIQTTGEMAVATAYARFAAVSEETGKEIRYLQNRLTWVVQKKDGAWKIIHEHTSGPVDGATMQVRLQR